MRSSTTATLLILILLGSFTQSCRRSGRQGQGSGETMQEQLQGVWILRSMDIIDRSKADTEYLFMVEEANMMGLYFGMNGLMFRDRREVVFIRDGFDMYEDYKLGYRLLNRRGRLDEDGRTIEFFLRETPPEYAGLSEPPGPYEILAISANELIVRDLDPNTTGITKNNMALRFTRLEQ